jgi:hypothetical protein
MVNKTIKDLYNEHLQKYGGEGKKVIVAKSFKFDLEDAWKKLKKLLRREK